MSLKNIAGIKLVLFDLDGTLVDTVELIYLSFKHATKTVLGKTYSREKLLQNLGRPLLDQMLYFSPAHAEELIEVYHRHNLAHHDQMIKPYPGTAETLAELKAQGLRIGVVTSKRRDLAERGLRLCGLDGFIEKLVAAEDTDRHKPDPEPIIFCLEKFQIAADNGVFIGDSPFDLSAGRAAGTQTIAALWGPFPPAELAKELPAEKISEISELPKLLQGSQGAISPR